MCETFCTLSLRLAREHTREQRAAHNSMSPNELLEKISNDKKFEESVIHTFNFWERIALSIQNETADENYLKNFFSDTFIDQHDRFKIWLEKVCADRNKKGYSNIESLYERWRECHKG